MTTDYTFISAPVKLTEFNDTKNQPTFHKEDRSYQTTTLHKIYPHLDDDIKHGQHTPGEQWTSGGDYDHEQYLYHQQVLQMKHGDRLKVSSLPPPSLKKHRDQLNELFIAQEQLDKASKELYWLFKENTQLKHHLNLLQWRIRHAESLWQPPIYRYAPDPIIQQQRQQRQRRHSTNIPKRGYLEQ